MDFLRNSYRSEEEEDEDLVTVTTGTTTSTTATDGGSGDLQPPADATTPTADTGSPNGIKEEPLDGLSEDEASDEDEEPPKPRQVEQGTENSKFRVRRIISGEDEYEDPPPRKQKPLAFLNADGPPPDPPSENSPPEESNGILPPKLPTGATTVVKKGKKRNNNVWTKPTSRKGKKKGKSNNNNGLADDAVFITPAPRYPDRNDDTPEAKICLSKVYKAERVELSEDKMCAGSTKGYRMVRATRGVAEGAWYFEIKVVKLGESGHTRLGWSTEKGDLQAPVGYDGNSFGYRDIDGCKIHKALREKYGEEGYVEGDVIGFYINLPEGNLYVPKQSHLVVYRGQRFVCAPDAKEDPPKIVPGSEISFFKNGVCQGVAFKDIYGGRYYPAASMYTLPSQPNCTVKFNFGPDFEFFPEDFNGRPAPRPMIEVPYHGFDDRVENGDARVSSHLNCLLRQSGKLKDAAVSEFDQI